MNPLRVFKISPFEIDPTKNGRRIRNRANLRFCFYNRVVISKPWVMTGVLKTSQLSEDVRKSDLSLSMLVAVLQVDR